jgi:hypothetical protein
MLHPIIEEVWTTGADPKPLRRARIKDARDGWNAAYQRARELAAHFDESDFVHDEQHSYAWGRNKDSRATYRYIVK